MSGLRVTTTPGGSVRIDVRVTPRASRSEIAGARDGALLVRINAPPVDGKANDALIDLLARTLRLRRSAIRIVRGPASREKTVEFDSIQPGDLIRALGLADDGPSR